MCGICGIVNSKTESVPDKELLFRMLGRLKHRGPDASGIYRDRTAALGHTRLSIIDLEGGTQPMSNEDESIWITFNGEIFNYIELKEQLIKKGHVFKTKSDTEVIIHAYEEWNVSCFEKFNGQWAFALWDIRNKKLIISRDRHGIRPLYYTFHNNLFYFASEIKAIFADNSVTREFDPAGLNEVFTFWSPVAPRTVFRNIYELKPGHYGIIKDNNLFTKAYFNIDFPEAGKERNIDLDRNTEQLYNHFLEASKLRFTRSDVPVGAYLSGGIDSSISSAVVTNYTKSPLKTFSIRFKDSEFDEGKYQEEMVKHLKTEHRDVAVSNKDIGRVFPKVIWHAERPILRTAPAPLFLLSKLVRESGYKVVVTGEGADEVLAGYDIFREEKVRRFVSRDKKSKKRTDIILNLYPWMVRSPGSIPAFGRAFFSQSLDQADPGFSHRPRWNTTSSIKLLLSAYMNEEMAKTDVINELLKSIPLKNNKWDSLCRSQWIEMATLLSGYILSAQGDRMLMANSVEGRFPFLDCNLIEFSNNLPARHKLLALNEKYILKKAFSNMIPEIILNRPKQPYRAPDAASFFFDGNMDWLDEITHESIIKESNLFNPKAVSVLLNKCKNVKGLKMSNTDNMRIVAVLSGLLTYKYFIKGNGNFEDYEKTPAEPVKIIDKI